LLQRRQHAMTIERRSRSQPAHAART
jgi:hypothetical protein